MRAQGNFAGCAVQASYRLIETGGRGVMYDAILHILVIRTVKHDPIQEFTRRTYPSYIP